MPLFNEFPLKPREDLEAQRVGPAIIGRLKDGVSVDQANAEFIGLARRLAQENPKTNGTACLGQRAALLNTFTGPQLRQTV